MSLFGPPILSCSSFRTMPSCILTEAWLDTPVGHRFYTRTYQADAARAVLIFVHGFADHISRYENIHTHFARRGITVFAYDLRGFGRTALDETNRSSDEYYGKTSRLLEHGDLEHWVHHISRTYPDKPIFVMGHSAVSSSPSTHLRVTPHPKCLK